MASPVGQVLSQPRKEYKSGGQLGKFIADVA